MTGFKNRIKELRVEKGLSQQAVADSIYVSRSAVAKWENGLGLPSKESLRLLSEFFGIEENELLKEQQYEIELVSKNIKINRMKLSIFLGLGVIVVLIVAIIGIGYLNKAADNNHLLYNDVPIVTINNEEITYYQIGSEYKKDANGDLKRYDYVISFPNTQIYEEMNLISADDLYQIKYSTPATIFGTYYYLNEDYSSAEETSGWEIVVSHSLNIENDGTFIVDSSSFSYIVIELVFEFQDLSVNYCFIIDLR